MSDRSATYLARALRSATHLRRLVLNACQITPNGAVILASVLPDSKLNTLSISGDPLSLPLRVIDGVGVSAIARAVMYPTCHIKELRCVKSSWRELYSCVVAHAFASCAAPIVLFTQCARTARIDASEEL